MIKKSALPLFYGLVLLFLIMSVTTYSYWDNLTQEESNNSIVLGSGVDIVVKTVEVAFPLGKTLIPQGMIKGINDIDEIELQYEVKLSKKVLEALTLEISTNNIIIGGSSTYSSLVGIEILQSNNNINDDIIYVSVFVSLNSPQDSDAYQNIIGMTIMFDLKFAAIH